MTPINLLKKLRDLIPAITGINASKTYPHHFNRPHSILVDTEWKGDAQTKKRPVRPAITSRRSVATVTLEV